ncbi:MAG TPA: hypothetical protein VEC37_12070 [Bacillota bacterium]|nr:hypothetical protein [Bacillota bacterium]
MPYQHYGEIGDVWKHLPLCEIIKELSPKVYIESNSAYPYYRLRSSVRRKYGVYYFLENAARNPVLSQTKYYEAASKNILEKIYLGSPGLALTLLGEDVDYTFCDIDGEALKEIKNYSDSIITSAQITLYNGDSIEYLLEHMANLPSQSLLFLDPYLVLEKNQTGHSFFDLFQAALKHKIPVALWYGYNTRCEQKLLHETFSDTFGNGSGVALAEINLANIGEDKILMNPGVPGCGLLMGNFEPRIITIVNKLCIQIKNLYANSVYNNHSGKLQITMRYF